ncbi:unnamed protein product, partial [Rotaria sp. Silwood1]
MAYCCYLLEIVKSSIYSQS